MKTKISFLLILFLLSFINEGNTILNNKITRSKKSLGHCETPIEEKINDLLDDDPDLGKPVNPNEPGDDDPEDSGLDAKKYLELDILENGTYELPENAYYDTTIGQKLLKYVKPGDIMYDANGMGFNGFGSGHIAIIETIAYSTKYQKNYVVTIEANPGHGVKRGYIDENRFFDYKAILRVRNATQSIIDNALYFCRQQIGKSYSYNFITKHSSINEDEWYCSELIYAAYLYNGTGIDLDNGAPFGLPPQEIYNDSDTVKILKFNSTTNITTTDTQHTFLCDEDNYTENHDKNNKYGSVDRCSVCDYIFWPTC